MSPRPGRRGSRAGVGLAERIEALDRAAAVIAPVAPASEGESVAAVLERIDRRRALSAEHTIIGFFGATGSGKSSLVNAVVGREVTRAAVRRPTTGHPVAAVVGEIGADPLLDWLGVEDRHLLDGTGAALEQAALAVPSSRRARRENQGAPGIVLLDLPDMDSVEAANRAIVEHMTGMVDVLVWVTDPQKYADAVLHQEFVRPLAGHDAVTVLVLNQIDRIREDERRPVLASLEGIARADGLTSAPVLATSATTGDGVEELRERLVQVARSRGAIAERQRADVTAAATRLRTAAEPAGMAAQSSARERAALTADLAVAARVEPVATAVGASYRHRAAGKVGWPPLRWVRRFRPDPLRRLGIGQERDANRLERTSLPEPDAATRARASGGVRRFADAASAGGSDPWRAAVRDAARSEEDSLPDALDQAVAGADLHARSTSGWWPVLDVLQWLAVLTWVVGLGWLGLNALLAFLGVPPPPMPMVEDLWIPIPLPTVMMVVGIAAGILIGVAGGAIAALVGLWHRRRARRVLTARVRAVADERVVAAVAAELSLARDAARDLALARG